MNTTQIYSDLSEITGFGYNSKGKAALDDAEELVKTEACMATIGYDYDKNHTILRKNGWTLSKLTSNWHYVHNGDKLIKLYFKMFPKNNGKHELVKGRIYARSNWEDHRTLSGGCDVGSDSDWVSFCKMQHGNR